LEGIIPKNIGNCPGLEDGTFSSSSNFRVLRSTRKEEPVNANRLLFPFQSVSASFQQGVVHLMMEHGKRNSHETRAEDRMDQNELEEPHDDFAVEITNLHHDNEEGSSRTPRFFMEHWLLSPKYRKQKTIATAIGMGLALLIVLFALTPVSRLFLHGSPPTVEPSTYYFGLDANPPWGSLSVDGKRMALFSRGAYTLFSLPPGQHMLTWYATPFAPQQCQLSVPLDFGSTTCQFTDAAPDLGGTISAYIGFPTNLTMLSAGQRTALIQAAQTVLDRQQSSETVQAGEVYAQTSAVSGTNTRSCTVVLQRAAICFATAHQPLKATLRLQLDTGPSPAACANGACDSGNPDCRLFCDIPAFVGSNIALSPALWQVSVQVQLLWQFATQDGRVVEENQADSFILGQQNALTFPLNITWNGMRWGVTPDRQSGPFGSDDAVCQAAVGDLYTLVFASTPPNTEPQLVPGPTSATGCLITIPLQSGVNGTPMPTPTASTVAHVIQRFGVLLAVNAVAHRLWPFLPVADAATQHLAQQLITKGGRALSNGLHTTGSS